MDKEATTTPQKPLNTDLIYYENINNKFGFTITTNLTASGGGSGSVIITPYLVGPPASTTDYFPLGGDLATQTEADVKVNIPSSGTINNFYLKTSNGTTQPASGSYVWTLRKNGAATGITITIPANTVGNTVFSDLTHSVAVTQGDTLDWQAVNNATAQATAVQFCSIQFTSAATSGTFNDGYIFTPSFPCEVISVIEKHSTAGSSNPTLDVLKVPNGTAISGGSSILAATFDLTSTANTAVIKQALDLNNKRTLAPLDSLAIKISGTTTSLAGVQVTIYCKPQNMGQFKNY